MSKEENSWQQQVERLAEKWNVPESFVEGLVDLCNQGNVDVLEKVQDLMQEIWELGEES